ncbi:MAG: SCO family protein [Acidobacteria bacterium]|nr:SCO family protein [Acidobacteriota bacterium]
MSEEGSRGAEGEAAPPRRRLLNPWFLAAFAGVVLIPALRPLLRFEPDPPPVAGQLPEWRLVDQNGEAFGSADLAGDVYVASFLFTRCPNVCPRMTASLRQLELRYREEGVRGVRLVSFSVDPAYDSPERLREYGRSRGFDDERWSLVTGNEQEVRSLVEDGFGQPMGENLILWDGAVDVAHSTRLVLVDQGGRIRGDYGSDRVGLDEVFHRARQVLAE